MTSRAVLLPTAGDPFITAAWLSSYKKFYQPYVDKLYVSINTFAEDRIFDYVVDMFKEVDAEIISHRHMTDHGPAITELVDACKEDYIFLAEDDFYIQTPNQLHAWFSAVEAGHVDAFGSKRGCVGTEITNAMAKKFNLTGEEVGQPNYWPALWVGKTEDLRKTDKDFAGKVFKAGEYIPQLDFTPTVDTGGDTFVWASIQLRALGLKIVQVPHYRWIDVLYAGARTPPWIHIGSSSTSLNGHLLDEDMTSIASSEDDKVRDFPFVPDEGLRTHYTATFAGWSVYQETFPIPEDNPASYFNQVYKDAIQRNVTGCNLNSQKMEENKTLYRKLLKPILGN